MGFRQAVTVCIQDYYTFSGRARRPEYWWFFLFILAGSLIFSAIDTAIFGSNMLLGLNGLFGLLTAVPQFAVSWRRLHDTGRPGWFNLLPLVPLVPLFANTQFAKPLLDQTDQVILFYTSVFFGAVILIWLVLPTKSGPNRFGQEPPS